MILKDYSGAKRFKRFKSIKITASPIIHLKDEFKRKKQKKIDLDTGRCTLENLIFVYDS